MTKNYIKRLLEKAGEVEQAIEGARTGNVSSYAVEQATISLLGYISALEGEDVGTGGKE